jgi:hypothetical protein
MLNENNSRNTTCASATSFCRVALPDASPVRSGGKRQISALTIPPSATRFGFSLRRSGGHLSRSMMLPELQTLLAAVSPEGGRADYRAAIVDVNVLGKPTAILGSALIYRIKN